MAEYTKNLNLFKPGSDDYQGIEATLTENFVKIDQGPGSYVEDKNGKKWTSLGERLDDYLKKIEILESATEKLKSTQGDLFFGDGYFRTVAHRGGHGAPENTLASLRKAIEVGFWGVEFDVQLTNDDVWVVIHDTTVDRTGRNADGTKATGTVAQMFYAQLMELDFGSYFSKAYANERIPTLDQMLHMSRHGQVVPFIEIKGGPWTDVQIKSLVDKVKEWKMLDKCVIIAFDLEHLEKVRAYSKTVPLGYLSKTFDQGIIDATEKLGNAFCNIKYDAITKEMLDKAKEKDLNVSAWTVNSTQEMRRLADLGVKTIATDRLAYDRGF